MANFWDELNAKAQAQAAQGANHSWEAYAKTMQPTTPVKKKKGFWEDQISTGGSIGGALAGGAAGTAILPGVGTLIGALIGGAAGGAGGQVVENKVTGEQDLMKDVGTEALWGGATALPFGAVGKLGKAGFTVAKGAGSTAARQGAMDLVREAGVKTMAPKALQKMSLSDALTQPMKEAAERVATAPTLAQKLGGKLSGTADDFAVKQFRLTPTQLANYNKKFGEDAGQTIRKYGFTSADDIALNGIDPLQTQFSETVKGIGAIPAATIKQNLDAAAKKLTSSAVSDNKAIGKSLQSEADQLIKRFGKDVDASELNAIRREYDSLVNYTNSVADPARYSVNKRVADALRKTLQSSDATGTLKQTGRELQKLRQLSDVVAKQGELGRGSLPAGLNLVTGAVLGGSGGGIGGALAGAAGQAVVNSPMSRRAMMGVADKLASKLSSSAPKEAGQSLAQTITRMGGIGAGRSMIGGDQSSLENSAIAPKNTTDSMNMPITSNMDSPYTQPEQPSSPLGVSSAEIGQALMRAYVAGDAPAIKQLEGMYSLASEFEKANSTASKPLSAEASKQVANANTGLQALATIRSAIESGSGVQGKSLIPGSAFGGLAGAILGTGSYEAARSQAIDVIGRMRSGGAITADEEKRFRSFLPQPYDDAQTSQYKLGMLEDAFMNLSRTGGGQIDASTLSSLLGQ